MIFAHTHTHTHTCAPQQELLHNYPQLPPEVVCAAVPGPVEAVLQPRAQDEVVSHPVRAAAAVNIV